jgi:hypothetical protein
MSERASKKIGRGVESESLSSRFLEEHENRRQTRNALDLSRVFEIRVPSCCNPSQLIVAQAVDGGHITI